MNTQAQDGVGEIDKHQNYIWRASWNLGHKIVCPNFWVDCYTLSIGTQLWHILIIITTKLLRMKTFDMHKKYLWKIGNENL